MPTYEYECKTCSHHFEAFQSMSDDPLTSCPKCGKDVRRLLSGGTGIIFKGSGFYATDRRTAASAKAPAKDCQACPGATACPSANSEGAKSGEKAAV